MPLCLWADADHGGLGQSGVIYSCDSDDNICSQSLFVLKIILFFSLIRLTECPVCERPRAGKWNTSWAFPDFRLMNSFSR